MTKTSSLTVAAVLACIVSTSTFLCRSAVVRAQEAQPASDDRVTQESEVFKLRQQLATLEALIAKAREALAASAADQERLRSKLLECVEKGTLQIHPKGSTTTVKPTPLNERADVRTTDDKPKLLGSSAKHRLTAAVRRGYSTETKTYPVGDDQAKAIIALLQAFGHQPPAHITGLESDHVEISGSQKAHKQVEALVELLGHTWKQPRSN